MKKMSIMMSAVLACALLVGCGANTYSGQESKQEIEPESEQKLEQESEQSMLVQGEETPDARDEEYPRGEQIEDQTFELNLEPIGEVTFASYLPDDSTNPLADVVFFIEQDGKILSQLPGETEDNVNTEMFHQVEAVNFSDFNSDGCDDIILIISYYLGAGPQAATPHSTVRYYTGSETGEFTYQKQMSEDATVALAELTIDSAKGFIGYDGSGKDEMQNGAGEDIYEAFLNSEISVPNPYVEGAYLTVMDDEKYETEFEGAQKSYTFVDVNNDEEKELIFKISTPPSELMYILGIYNDELICFDVKETHTSNMAFGVYDYGMVWEIQNFDGFGMMVYSYTADGKPIAVRHFTEANEADIAAYEGGELEWFDWSVAKSNADKLLDSFLAGEINADGNGLYSEESFNISDLPMPDDDWFSYSVGDRLDLDNDGENEQILNGPYGGMYLDASEDGVKVFASGNGTASTIYFVYCDDECWIVHSDVMHGGRAYYELEKYSGADNVVERATLAHFWTEDETVYEFNNIEISEAEYDKYYRKFFGE